MTGHLKMVYLLHVRHLPQYKFRVGCNKLGQLNLISPFPVGACVSSTGVSYQCVPCHPWCTHRTFLVVKKKISVFLWLRTIPLRHVLWFSCYKCLYIVISG